MQMQVNKGDIVGALKRSWLKRRPENGYSYLDVLHEVKRRKKGDFLLALESRDDALQAGVHRLATQFAISAVLSEIMEGFELTGEELLALFGCEKNDPADVLLSCILNPYPRSVDAPISVDENVDVIYPGRVVTRK